RSNKVEGLKIDDGGWCFNDEMLKQHAVEFFQNLYRAKTFVIETFPCRGMFPVISTYEREMLSIVATDEKIRRTIFSMTPLKAPAIDGYHAKFYQSQWDIIGDSFCSMVWKVLEGHGLDPMINRTLIVLISKVQGSEIISQSRPISLCTVLYKISLKL
ncbi:hypothetical protein V6Z12_D07G133800, partial [Gossypium hirsutum]